jgi:hypothetical protein
MESTKVFRIHLAKSNNTFLYFTHTTDKQISLIHKMYIKSFNESNLLTNHNKYPNKIKSSNVSV